MMLLLAASVGACADEAHHGRDGQVAIFRAGEGGYHTYRIPAIVTTTKGTLLAFCEGRKNGGGDAGDIDLVLRRSTDSGKTWGPMQVVVDDGEKTCGNPCPIVDRDTGNIVLLITTNGRDDKEHKIQAGEAPPRIAWVLRSTDDGVSWTAPRDISATTREENYRWYATGPGHGIQLASGRMIAPCDHSTGPAQDQQFSHVIYSDDGGRTWALGGTLGEKTNECIAVETAPGTLYVNSRNHIAKNQRVYSISRDAGLTFEDPKADEALPCPVCQASALLIGPGQVLFSNPASPKRENMTLRLSADGAKTWEKSITLWSGPSAYSDLAQLPNGDIACLYERGDKHPYETITLAIVPPAELDGR